MGTASIRVRWISVDHGAALFVAVRFVGLLLSTGRVLFDLDHGEVIGRREEVIGMGVQTLVGLVDLPVSPQFLPNLGLDLRVLVSLPLLLTIRVAPHPHLS
jgi:hypothetical protein